MQEKTILKTAPIIKKYNGNPILTAKDIPYNSTLIFNAGVTKYHDKYIMVFRNDYGNENACEQKLIGTNLGIAYSSDGINWEVDKKILIDGSYFGDSDISRIYDPRLSIIEDRIYMCFAVDTGHGVRGGIAVTKDFKNFDILDLSVPDNRNMVLFPEKINNKFVRLERPFPVYSRGGKERFDIWVSDSYDARYWGNSKLLLGVEHVPYANNKIGPAAPPIKTKKGWLTTFHAVDFDEKRGKNGWEVKWQKKYYSGIMLLDLDEPSKVIGMSKLPLIVPEELYEIKGGFRNDVIFPGGMILEDTGEVKIYYGSADTCECLAVADVNALLALCSEKK